MGFYHKNQARTTEINLFSLIRHKIYVITASLLILRTKNESMLELGGKEHPSHNFV